MNILNNYHDKLSEKYIENDIISRVIQYELLQYFNLFANEKLRPLYCEFFYNNDLQYNNLSNYYCILMNLSDNIT